VQNDFTGPGLEGAKQGLYALEKSRHLPICCAFRLTGAMATRDTALYNTAAAYCTQRRAFMIIDPPAAWTSKSAAISGLSSFDTSNHAAIFFPRLIQPDPLNDNQSDTFAPCGAVAGVIARTDAARGVWKAPAGLEANLIGVPQLSVPLTDGENGELNPLESTAWRALPAAGRVVWARAHSRALTGWLRNGSTPPYAPGIVHSKKACIAVRSGWSSSPMTNRCGRRFAST